MTCVETTQIGQTESSVGDKQLIAEERNAYTQGGGRKWPKRSAVLISVLERLYPLLEPLGGACYSSWECFPVQVIGKPIWIASWEGLTAWVVGLAWLSFSETKFCAPPLGLRLSVQPRMTLNF